VSTKQTLTAGVLDLTRRTKAACYLLWAFAGIAGLILASDLVRLQLLSDTTFNIIGEAVENNLAIHRVLGFKGSRSFRRVSLFYFGNIERTGIVGHSAQRV
jgi:hypothetical protein